MIWRILLHPLNVAEFEFLLRQSNYNRDESKFLIDGFTNRFNIQYYGNRKVRCFSPNLELECGSREDL